MVTIKHAISDNMFFSDNIYLHTTNFEQNLIFNGLTGGLCILNKELTRIISERDYGSLPLLSEYDYNSLLSANLIVNDTNELSKLVYNNYYQFIKEPQEKNSIVLAITYDCNLICPYCFERNNCSRSANLNYSLDSVFKFIDDIYQHNNKKTFIELFGGEPLLNSNKHIIDEVLSYAQSRGFTIGIVTNGVEMDFFYDLLSQYKGIIETIQVTIDGGRHNHNKKRFLLDQDEGTFDLVIDNIIKFVRNGFNISLRINIDSNTINDIMEVLNILHEKELLVYRNFDYYFAPITSNTKIKSDELIDEADLAIALDDNNLLDKGSFTILGYLVDALGGSSSKRLPSFRRCYANNKNSYVIGADGEVYGCCEQLGVISDSRGNIYDGFDKVKYPYYIYDNVLNEGLKKCRNCNIALLCGGGCIKAHLNEDYCTYQKEVLNKYFNYLREKYALI